MLFETALFQFSFNMFKGTYKTYKGVLCKIKEKHRMLEFCKLKILLIVVFIPSIIPLSHKYSLKDSARYTDIIDQVLNITRMTCVALCDRMDECTSVNYNTIADMCELTSHVPRLLTPETATEPNWTVYYNDRIILAVDEWQTSTYIHTNGPLSASYATDGNRDNNDQPTHLYCASSAIGYSSWGMEFERVAKVSYVLIFFRNAITMNERNTNLRFLISPTRQDSDNNVGTDCATFVGPPASPTPPAKINCSQPVTGKFLKIIHNSSHPLTLCEVEVYST